MRVAVVAVFVVSACYSPHYEDCAISCVNQACPSGLMCIANECRTAGGVTPCPTRPDDDAATDSLFDAPYPTGMWSPPAQVALSLTNVGDATLTPDLLELYVAYQGDIYVATRTSANLPWSDLALVQITVSPAVEQTPTISSDGLTLMFSSARTPSLGGQDIYVTTRSSRASAWGQPGRLDELSSASDDSGAYMTPDELTLVLGSTRGPSGMLDIYISTRTSKSERWAPPVEIPELNIATSGDSHAILSPDLKTIYFQSNRTQSVDLWMAHRDSPTAMFNVPTSIDELNNATGVDGDPWVSPDGHHLFFTKGVGGVTGIWETSR